MNFFEQELRKLVGQSNALSDPRYIGRACYGRVSDNIRAKLGFITMGTYEKYEALKTTLINNTEGEIDCNIIRFLDVWGVKKLPIFRRASHLISGRITEKPSGTVLNQTPPITKCWPTVWTNILNCSARTWSTARP